MTLYKVALRMASDIPGQVARKWSTTFYTDAANPAAAAAAYVGFWTAYLRNAARTRVYCYEAYATDLNPASTSYSVQSVPIGSQRGTLAAGAGEPYLPKVVVAVTLPVFNSRPSRKFWRPGLWDADITNGVSIDTVLAEAIRSQFQAMIADNPGLVLDPDGEQLDELPTLRLTTREFGRESTNLVPTPPPLG